MQSIYHLLKSTTVIGAQGLLICKWQLIGFRCNPVQLKPLLQVTGGDPVTCRSIYHEFRGPYEHYAGKSEILAEIPSHTFQLIPLEWMKNANVIKGYV